MDIVVKEELKAYIDPLTADEHDALERSILAEGCRDALVLWGNVLVDGHNRFGICQKHGLPFNTVQNTRFQSMEDVHLWMIEQHLGRRSVSDFQRGVLALRKRDILAARKQVEQAQLQRESDGTADVVMTGGSEACMTPTAISAFARMTALSTRNDDPERASRPFDAERDGFVMGEGAAALVLERWDRAKARGARIYGEVVGYGRNADAYHITAPSPGGEGAAACMQLALEDAGLPTTAIGHINAHGTSTPLNDAAEAEAIRKVFGDTPPPVTSTKGVTGHLVGAAGATEAAVCLLALARGAVPPTANLERLGPDIALDVVAGEARPIAPAPVLSNSFGFGGTNATLVFKRMDA